MRTYKEPKRIDKPRIRDSAIRQLNDAAKFAAIHSAAVSLREEEENARKCEDRPSGSCDNHVTQDFSVEKTVINCQTESYKTEVSLTTGTVTITEVANKPFPLSSNEPKNQADDKDSSFSSSLSSIPTDSYISSDAKLSDLDNSGISTHDPPLSPHQTTENGMDVDEKKSDAEDSVPETKKSTPSKVEKKKAPKPVKKKAPIDRVDKKSPKEKVKKVPVKKKINKNAHEGKIIKNKTVKGKKKAKTEEENEDVSAVDSSFGDISKTDESGASVSPRASKRTPKRNRKYHSDDEQFHNMEDGSPSRKRSPRAVRKRKINFNEDEDDEFEDERFDFDVDLPEKVEVAKPKPPPKKWKKVELNSEHGNRENDNDSMITDDLIPKPKKTKGLKKVKTEINSDSVVVPNEIEKVEKDKDSPPKKKKLVKKKKVESVKDKDNGEKDSATSEVKKPPKKKRPPKKKVEKSVEGKENGENITGEGEEENEEGSETEVKKEQVIMYCPLCGHISRSKSANTRHIRRCVEIPRSDIVAEKSTESGKSMESGKSAEVEEKEKKESLDETEKKEEKDEMRVDQEKLSNDEVKENKEDEENESREEKDHLDSSFDLSGDEEENVEKQTTDSKPEGAGPKKSINIETLMKKQSPDTTFKCEHCEYATPKRAMLGRHLRTHGIYVCLRCNLIYDSKEVLKEHVFQEHKDRADYKLCRKCSRYIRCHEISLEKHMDECTGPVPFKCKFCEKEFKYESSLKSHIIRHDPDAPKRFNCPQCTYKSNYKANLKKHLKNIHNTERVKQEFPCTFENCEKKFHTEDNLKRHLKFHSDVRNYLCPQCPKRFKTSAALRGHVIVHDPARPFKCNINDCTKDFRSKKLLKNHMEEYHNLTDKKFPCDFEGCKFTFFKRSHLQRHKISHTGERKFGCSVCGKAFRHADNLKVHMRQHTNEKPVACELCSFTCRQKSSLQYHLHKFHGIAPKPKKPKKQGDGKNMASTPNDSKLSVLSQEFKENQKDSVEKMENSFDSKPLTPKPKPVNPAMDLYEFRSDEEFDDDSVLLPLRQDKTSTPIRHEKPSYLSHTPKSDLLDRTSKSLDFDEDRLSDIDTQTDKKEMKDQKEKESKTRKEENDEEGDEPAKTTAKTKKPKKTPGRKKKVKDVETTSPSKPNKEESAKPEETKDSKLEKPVKPKGKRGRKPKPKPEEAETTETAADKKDSEQAPVKPPRKKPGPKPKNKAKSPEDAVKVPKKRGPKKKKLPVPHDELTEEEPSSPQKKKRKYVRKKKLEKQVEEKRSKGGKKREDAETEEEDTIIYSELEHNTANEDDGEATEIEGFNDEEGGSKTPDSPKSPEEPEEPREEVEKEKEMEVEKEVSEEEKEKVEEKVEEPVEMKSTKEEEEKRTSEAESDRMSSGIDTDFEDDLKPPPAPRPPPVVESDEGDIESGPEDMDTPGRDFESTPPKSVQNHSVQSLPGRDYESTPRDYESTPPKSVQPDSVPNYGSNENKNDVMSPPSKGYSSVEAAKRDLSVDSQNEDREISNPVPSNSYPQAGSVEHPSSVASNPPPGSQSNTGYGSQSESAMPEVDKDYLGQYLQQFDSGGRSSDDNSRLNPSVERPPEHINIPTSPQDKELPPLNLSSSVPPLNLSTTPDRDSMHTKGADLSNKRMEILACDRQQEEHFQQRSENPSRSSERIPDNVYDSLSSVMNSYLPGSRENPSLFPPTTTSSYAFSESESILQRQRMTTPFLTQSDPNALQNLHRMADSALTANNPASLLRRPTTVPSREEIFPPPSAVSQTMARNPFHTSWTSQDVRHPHWSQASYLQRQTGSTTNPLFPKDNYLPGRDFMFDTSRRTVTERNMFPGLPQTQRPDLPHETFPGFEFGYFGSHGYPGAPPLDYTRSSSQTAQKTFDERYRQTATGMGDFRTIPPSSSSDMFRSMNPSFNFDKYMYGRDPVYHPQHVGDTTNSPFLTHGVPSQHAMFDRDYTRGFYHQNSPYSFMNDKPYAAAAAAASAKLTHSSTPGMGQDRDFVPRPNTAAAAAADSQIPMQDPYRHPMLYNMMNRYFES